MLKFWNGDEIKKRWQISDLLVSKCKFNFANMKENGQLYLSKNLFYEQGNSKKLTSFKSHYYIQNTKFNILNVTLNCFILLDY